MILSIGSVSSQSLSDIDTADDMDSGNKVIKSTLSSSLSNKTTTLSTAIKTNATKVTNASKTTTNTNKTTKTATKSSKSAKNKTTTTTVNKKTLAKASTSFMNSVEKNGKFPKVKISNKNYSNTEYLYLMSKSVENNSKSKIDIKSNLVKPYNNTKCKSVKGTITKAEYVKIAGKTRKFIEKNQRAPNWASSSKGNIPYNQLILLYGKCLDTYNKTNKLPNSVNLDNLDLDVIKSKINKKSAKTTNATKQSSAVKASANRTNSTNAKKTNTTSISKTNSTNAKKTNATSVSKTNSTSTIKANATSTNKNVEANTSKNSVDGNISLVERSMNYVNSILNSILDKLDPSKYKFDITKSDEANVKFNTSKVNVDVSGKSSVNVKVSAKDNKANSSKSTATKKTTTKKTNSTKASTSKKTTTKKTNSTKSKKTSGKTASKLSDALKKYLSNSKNCQVSNNDIKKLAKTLTSSLKTDYDKAKKLFAWVRDNIQYEKYRNTQKGAVKTLKKKHGNCVDQSHLLIALSRAAGIPARYVNGGNCKFTSGYVSGHVWTQLYIKNKWVVADTTSTRNTLGNIKNWNTKNYVLYGTYSSINF